ncbi:MlaE family ABC transporter permease [Pelagibacterium luteolum]|uniref:Phospholipid/cholesterol/gamma-HCH transport system permease protein n=1 Tax=Pelagibacterium luteolum TaxID=440168 RepID=A0A1G7VWZ1_9HYPH|nr:ABC transporter permease [Pelagibacterium luteolum]SDG64111.1 phospholipid/cholesterol/gamma-HCH transport system permease protein [Pelagibacterium luteolum]
MTDPDDPHIEISGSGTTLVARLSGAWTTRWAREMQKRVDDAFARHPKPQAVQFDLAGVSSIDTVGALMLAQRRTAYGSDVETSITGATPSQAALLGHVNTLEVHSAEPRKRLPSLVRPFDALGHMTANAVSDLVSIHAVLGRTLAAAGATLTFRAPFRFAALVNQFDLIALRAVPIVVLISVVVGAIVTQQSILQLNNFGVAIYVVDLAAILMLREVGLLLAAIMIAGRSGSAITAELGSMRMREELDALSVMGVDPYQALILPRMVALLIGLPFLAFIGALSGLAGAAIVALIYGGIPLDIFLDRLQGALNLRTLMVGLIKAPVMAIIIGLVATNEGFKVAGSAESLGRHTTASVVRAIFLVIVADGVFAMFFAAIGF